MYSTIIHRIITYLLNVHHLVYYEEYQKVEEAILREKQMKKWNRKWKIRCIEENNPEWKDLYNEIV